MTDTMRDPEDEQDPDFNRRLMAQLLASAGWDRADRDPHADCDGKGKLKRFVKSAFDLRDALNTSEVRLETVMDLIALTEMRTKPWRRFVDPALSAQDKRGRPIAVLYECPEHKIAVRFGASQWIVRRGDQILHDAEDFVDGIAETEPSEFEPEVFERAAAEDGHLSADEERVRNTPGVIDTQSLEVARRLE